jgi:hypothetical protein
MSYQNNDIRQTILIPTTVGLVEHGLTLGFRTIIDHKQYNTQYSSSINIAKQIYISKGISGFFRGGVPMLTSVCASHSALFYCLNRSKSENKDVNVALWGAMGKFCHDAFMVPGDTIRQRSNLLNLTVMQSIKNIYRASGSVGFFYGLLPSLLISIPTGSIEFYTVKKLSDKYGSDNMFLWGGIAGIVSSVITTPIDKIKTMYQTDGVFRVDKSLKLSEMFRGCVLRSFSASITYGLYAYLSNFIHIEHD